MEFNAFLRSADRSVSVDALCAVCGEEIAQLVSSTADLRPVNGIFTNITPGEVYHAVTVREAAAVVPPPAVGPPAAAPPAANTSSPPPPVHPGGPTAAPAHPGLRHPLGGPNHFARPGNAPIKVVLPAHMKSASQGRPAQTQTNVPPPGIPPPTAAPQKELPQPQSPAMPMGMGQTTPQTECSFVPPPPVVGGDVPPPPVDQIPPPPAVADSGAPVHHPAVDVAAAVAAVTPAVPETYKKDITGGFVPQTVIDAANSGALHKQKKSRKAPLSLGLDGEVSIPVSPVSEPAPPSTPETAAGQAAEMPPSTPSQENAPSMSPQMVPVNSPSGAPSTPTSGSLQHNGLSGLLKRFVKKSPGHQSGEGAPLSPSDPQSPGSNMARSSSETFIPADGSAPLPAGEKDGESSKPEQHEEDKPKEGETQPQVESKQEEEGDSGIQFLAPKPGDGKATDTIAAVLADFGDMPEDKNERLRLKCVREIIITEEAYVKDLELLESIFMIPIKYQKVLTPDQYQRLFSNAEMLKPIHTELLQALCDKDATQGGKYVGSAFLALCQYMKMYSVYCANHDNAVSLLEELKENKEFAHTLEICETDPIAKGQTLASFLIKPVQRVCKYPLFFRELLNYTPEDHPDHSMLEEAKSKIDGVVAFINEGKRKFEEQQKMVDILASIEGEWEEELITPTRTLVSETRISGRQKSAGTSAPGEVRNAQLQMVHEHQLFVFSDLIVICRCVTGYVSHSKPYQLRATIPMYRVRVVVIADDEKVQNAFEILQCNPVTNVVEQNGFQFYAKDAKEKDDLVHSIKGLVKETLKKFYSHRTAKSNMNLISLVPGGEHEGPADEQLTPPPAAVAAAAAGNEASLSVSVRVAQSMPERTVTTPVQVTSPTETTPVPPPQQEQQVDVPPMDISTSSPAASQDIAPPPATSQDIAPPPATSQEIAPPPVAQEVPAPAHVDMPPPFMMSSPQQMDPASAIPPPPVNTGAYIAPPPADTGVYFPPPASQPFDAGAYFPPPTSVPVNPPPPDAGYIPPPVPPPSGAVNPSASYIPPPAATTTTTTGSVPPPGGPAAMPGRPLPPGRGRPLPAPRGPGGAPPPSTSPNASGCPTPPKKVPGKLQSPFLTQQFGQK